MLDALPRFAFDNPLLSMDLEGLNLGKSNGVTYLLQIYDCLSHHLDIVDICVLGHIAFSTLASNGETTLKGILESPDMLKLFCDARGDSYALFREFGIRLQGVKDLQDIQMASRRDLSDRRWRSGLAALIHRYAELSEEEKDRILVYKKNGRDFCSKWRFVQFSIRPLRGDLTVYAGNNVLLLPKIYSNLVWKMSAERLESADVETEKSILETQNSQYDAGRSQV